MSMGDRKDGVLLKSLDSLHQITAIIYPNRCDNEAFISELIDLSKLNTYLEKKNYDGIEYMYNIFQVIVTATLKTIYLRPVMNRFIVNGDTYQRKNLNASFVVKKLFKDGGAEGLAKIEGLEDDNINTIHDKIYKIVSSSRGGNKDGSTEAMDGFSKLPRGLKKAAIRFICFLDKHGLVPESLIESDPYYCSVVLTNLGSLKMHAGYHHLTNWGTTSVFVCIGERKERIFARDDGSFEMRDSIDIGLTIDERLADGYYYSKTIKLLKYLIENPELLEASLSKELEEMM